MKTSTTEGNRPGISDGQSESRRNDDPGSAGPPPAKAFQGLGAYALLLFALLPTMFLLALVYLHIDENLRDIKTAADNTNNIHLPGILKEQRTLINIENLRRNVETVYNASTGGARREALIDALALSTESVFEANSRFVEYAGAVKSLLYALDAVKKRSTQARDELRRAEALFARAAGRLSVYAGTSRDITVFPPHEDALRALEPIFTYCGKLKAAPGTDSRALAECASLRENRDRMEAARRSHVEADAEAYGLWKQLDGQLRKLSDLAASQEAELTYRAMEHIHEEASRARFTFYFSGALIILILCFFILVLHRYILSPLALASRSLRLIRDGGSIAPLPHVRVRELQDMLGMLPVLSRYVTELSARSGLLEQEKDKFKNLSLVDGLTGVGNRRHFDACLDRSDRSRSLGLLMLDVDMFKLYNDAYGHRAGDQALTAVARAVRRTLRDPVEQVFRYGGEEFCVLLPGASEASALALGERLREEILALQLPHAGSPVAPYLTVSIGVSLREARAPMSNAELVTRADKALYQAKALRNRVCLLQKNEPPLPGEAAR